MRLSGKISHIIVSRVIGLNTSTNQRVSSEFFYPITEGYDVTTFEFASQKKEGKGGWEPSFASNLILNFRVLIQPYSSSLVNNFCWGGWALLSVSKLERQRTSGPQKRTKSDFMYCSQHLGASSRNPRRNPRWEWFTSTAFSQQLF